MDKPDINALKDLPKQEVLAILKPYYFKLCQTLHSYYLSPLSKLKIDIDGLQNRFLGNQPALRIEDPNSWIHALPEANHNIKQSILETYLQLEKISHYLSITSENKIQRGSVFENDYQAVLNQSLPYFEWSDTTHPDNSPKAITDYLGKPLCLCFMTSQTIEDIDTLLSLENKGHYLLIYPPHDAYPIQEKFSFFKEKITLIEDTQLHSNYLIANRFSTHYHADKPLLSVFKNTSHTYFVADTNAILKGSFTRNEIPKIQEMLSTILL